MNNQQNKNQQQQQQQRQPIDLETKKLIIDAAKTGQKSVEIAKQFSLDRSTICKILKRKERILAAIEAGGSATRKRIMKPSPLDQSLLGWLKHERSSNNFSINGPLLKEKALEFSRLLGVKHFTASQGWLTGFKERYSISFETDRKKRQRLQEEKDNSMEEGNDNGGDEEEGEEQLMRPTFSLSTFLNADDGELMEPQNSGEIFDTDQKYDGEEDEGNCSTLRDGQQQNNYLHANGGHLLAFEDGDYEDGDFAADDDNSSLLLDSKLKAAKIAYLEAQTELTVAQTSESRARESQLRAKESESRAKERESKANEKVANIRAKLLELEYQEKMRSAQQNQS